MVSPAACRTASKFSTVATGAGLMTGATGVVTSVTAVATTGVTTGSAI
jgi:hypothetical protein